MAERLDPSLTMLPLEDLLPMEDISGSTLYSKEVRRIPRLTKEEEKPYIDAARQGDKEARDILILNCLNWQLMRAYSIHQQAEPRHIEPMDLVGVGYLEMVEKLDRALELENPISYLMATASWEMQNEATFNDSMIMRPRMNREELKKRDPFPATDVSLEQANRYGVALQDVISAPVEVREPSKDYRPLYQAVEKLSVPQRRTVIENYGLYDQPAKPIEEIARRENRTKHNISSTLYKARRNLAKKLG